MLFGTMAVKSGLARRLAYSIMVRIGTTYSRLLLGLILSDFLLTFLVPSGPPRVIIMSTVALGLVEAVVGIANGVALVLTLTGRAWTALGIARIAVLAGLVAGGLLGTYVGQLGALADILLRVLLLLLVLDARARLREAR